MIVVIVAISFTSKQRTSANGCIDVSAATVIGGSELYRCGDGGTRPVQRAQRPRGGRQHRLPRALADACRKAGLPVPAVPASD